MSNDAKYVVFDGMDGSGKGTQIELLKQKFGDTAVFTREPGGVPLAEEIRKIVRDNPLAGQSTALFHFLAFWAAREELMHKLVMPALQSGKHVFSDRGDSSTFAFQLHGEKHLELFDLFSLMRKIVFAKSYGRHKPNLYVIFDLPAEVARERVMCDASRGETNHFDARNLEYYERVRNGFLGFSLNFSRCAAPVEFFDATQPPEKLHCSVMSLLARRGIIP